MYLKTKAFIHITSINIPRLLIISLAYFIFGWLGLKLAIVGSNITLIWLPTGIAVAALFRWGYQYWWAVWLGALLVNFTIGSSLLIAFGISIGNTLAPIAVVALLRQWHFKHTILSWHDVPIFAAASAFGMMLSATGGVAVLAIGHLLPWADVSWAWLAWWLGDTVGVIVGGMALITFERNTFIQQLSGKYRKELLASALTVIAISLAMLKIPASPINHLVLTALVILSLVWIALRLDAWSAATATLIISICAVLARITGHGQFAGHEVHFAIAELWAYITTLSIVTMLVSAFTSERKQMEEALKASQQRLNEIINLMPIAVFIKDAQSQVTLMNKTCELQWGISFTQIQNTIGKHIFPPEQLEGFLAADRKIFADGKLIEIEEPVWNAQLQANRIVHTYKKPVFNEAGQPEYLIGISVDVTERKQMEEQLRESESRFRLMADSAPVLIWIAGLDKLCYWFNKSWLNFTGRTMEQEMGNGWVEAVHPDDLQGCIDYYVSHFDARQAFVMEYRLKRYDGQYRWIMDSGVPRFDGNGVFAGFIGSCIDITERKQAEDTIKQLAFYDPLTKLPNRRLLQDRLKQALATSHRNASSGALLFIDMDNFKNLNDTLGHEMGDLLLIQVAERLLSCVRATDTVARLGGDEFIVLLENLEHEMQKSVAQAEMVGKKILFSLNQIYQLESHQYHSTPSIGVVLFNGYAQSSDELLKQADIAMYQAKAAGRNTIRFFNH